MAKVKKKNNKYKDDGTLDIVLGCLLFTICDFNDGNILEKIVVLGGFLILMVGIVKLLPKYKKEDKKLMVVLLGLLGLIAIISFVGLLLRLFGFI